MKLNLKSMKTVILGTAHGSNVPGKCSPDGRLREYRYSREVCRSVCVALKSRGVNCIIDIDAEQESSLSERVRLVNGLCREHGDCVYVSIHCNAAGSDGCWHDARGFAVMVAPNASQHSRRLATIFHRNAIAMGLQGNRCYPQRGYYEQSLAVCRDTRCPAVLTENLFQDNCADVNFLLSAKGRQVIVNLHVNSIIEYLNMLS